MSKVNDNSKKFLTFKNYFVDFVHFETNINFSKDESKFKIDFDVEREINDFDEDGWYAVSLIIKIFEDAISNNFPFSMNVKITGVFQLLVDDRDLLEQNAIAILFPYARALVSNYTANANVEPLILPPINVVAMLQKKENSQNNDKN